MNKKFLFALFVFPATLYITIRLLAGWGYTEIDRTGAQLICFPLVLLAFCFFRFNKVKLPILVLLFAATGGLVSSAYIYPGSLRSGVFVSRLENDEMQTETSKFRERINHYLKLAAKGEIRRYHQSFSSYSEVRDFIDHHQSVNAMVWGNQRWLNITFKDSSPLTLGKLGVLTNYKGLSSLEIVTSVKNIGLSFSPTLDTAIFIAGLVESIEEEPLESTLEIKSLKELALLSLAQKAATWTSFAHRAYPWMLLGNLYFQDAVRSGKYQPAVMKCAIKAYETARNMIRSNDNPELLAAVYNNQAVAYYTMSVYEGYKKFNAVARKNLRLGLKTKLQKVPLGAENMAISVIEKNLEVIKNSVRSAKKNNGLRKLKGKNKPHKKRIKKDGTAKKDKPKKKSGKRKINNKR